MFKAGAIEVVSKPSQSNKWVALGCACASGVVRAHEDPQEWTRVEKGPREGGWSRSEEARLGATLRPAPAISEPEEADVTALEPSGTGT